MANLTKAQVNLMLSSLLGYTSYCEIWWQTPNIAFNNLTPDEQWSQDPDRVQQYLLDLVTQ